MQLTEIESLIMIVAPATIYFVYSTIFSRSSYLNLYKQIVKFRFPNDDDAQELLDTMPREISLEHTRTHRIYEGFTVASIYTLELFFQEAILALVCFGIILLPLVKNMPRSDSSEHYQIRRNWEQSYFTALIILQTGFVLGLVYFQSWFIDVILNSILFIIGFILIFAIFGIKRS